MFSTRRLSIMAVFLACTTAAAVVQAAHGRHHLRRGTTAERTSKPWRLVAGGVAAGAVFTVVGLRFLAPASLRQALVGGDPPRTAVTTARSVPAMSQTGGPRENSGSPGGWVNKGSELVYQGGGIEIDGQAVTPRIKLSEQTRKDPERLARIAAALAGTNGEAYAQLTALRMAAGKAAPGGEREKYLQRIDNLLSRQDANVKQSWTNLRLLPKNGGAPGGQQTGTAGRDRPGGGGRPGKAQGQSPRQPGA
jgi:hypothetical protein